MEQNDFLVDKRIRERIGNGRKTYNWILGIFAVTIGLVNISEHGFSMQNTKAIFNVAYALLGILIIIFSIIGRKLFWTRYRLKIDNDAIRIKKSFETELIIYLKKVQHLKTLPLKLEITYNDFVKTYDFSWLTTEEFKDFHAKLSDYCQKNKIETE
jgi:hypothetical protein